MSLVLVACGANPKSLGPPRKDPPEGKCQPSALAPFHEVVIRLKGAPPPRLAVSVDGEKRLDECQRIPEKAPFVRLKREAGNELVLRVEHGGAYRALPEDFSFTIEDRGSCGRDEEAKELVHATRLKLDFQKDFPAGPDCGARNFSRTVLEGP